MKFRNKKVIGIVIALGVIALGAVFLLNSNKVIYGNNENEIKEAIYKTELIKSEELIDIIDVVDIGNSRLVGFCSNFGSTGIIEFEKNSRGKFEYKKAEVHGGQIGAYLAFVEDEVKENKELSQEKLKEAKADEEKKNLYIIVSDAVEGYDIKLKVNEEYNFEEVIPVGERKMIVFQIPSGEKEYVFDLEVVDSRGNKVF